jgi:hypothetical protein
LQRLTPPIRVWVVPLAQPHSGKPLHSLCSKLLWQAYGLPRLLRFARNDGVPDCQSAYRRTFDPRERPSGAKQSRQMISCPDCHGAARLEMTGRSRAATAKQDKRIGICILLFWARFRRKAPETGLSASPARFLRGLFLRYESGKQAVDDSMRLSCLLTNFTVDKFHLTVI